MIKRLDEPLLRKVRSRVRNGDSSVGLGILDCEANGVSVLLLGLPEEPEVDGLWAVSKSDDVHREREQGVGAQESMRQPHFDLEATSLASGEVRCMSIRSVRLMKGTKHRRTPLPT